MIPGKVVVLNLHPDLAGRLAGSGQLTKESTGEQRSAGLQSLSAEQKYTIDDFNEKYVPTYLTTTYKCR